jgi:hypothetical protein
MFFLIFDTNNNVRFSPFLNVAPFLDLLFAAASRLALPVALILM